MRLSSKGNLKLIYTRPKTPKSSAAVDCHHEPFSGPLLFQLLKALIDIMFHRAVGRSLLFGRKIERIFPHIPLRWRAIEQPHFVATLAETVGSSEAAARV